MLADKGPMLLEYFGVGFADSPEGLRLSRLPLLLDSYTPRVGGLPDFVVQLACDVNWQEEQACFKGVARVLADLYCLLPLLPPDAGGDMDDPEARKLADREEEAHRRSPASIHFITQCVWWAVLHMLLGCGVQVPSTRTHLHAWWRGGPCLLCMRRRNLLFPAIRDYLTAPQSLARDNDVIQLACTQQLYKIFERC